jgi:hypothetical protein
MLNKNAVFWDIKAQFLTSQEKHYVSATESGLLMLCKILGFHSDDYEECRLLGCYATLEPTFRRNVSLPSSG